MTSTSKTLHSHAPAAATRMGAAAAKFLETLSTGQREVAAFPFAGDERYIWNYTPVPRNGLLIKDMDDGQREVAWELMATGLSESGNDTAHQIISIETRADEEYVIRLPLTRFTTGIDQRWVLPVYGSRQTIGIGGVLVTVENLDFIFR